MGTFVDKTLQCVDCNEEFIFTEGEQEFFADKGFTNEPKRCHGCRKKRKEDKARGGKVETTVTCEQCGKETTVPFKPTGEKPVFCRDCFDGQNGGRDRGRRR